MGSRSKVNLAYIAGFLDGDGSLMLQIKNRKDGKLKWRFMATICFYQDKRYIKSLEWIRDILEIGYVSLRNDGIAELRINGFQKVGNILKILIPFIRLKKVQAQALYEAIWFLQQKKGSKFTPQELSFLVENILLIQEANYKSRRKRTREELYLALGLTP